jgi:hypothetical protein
VCIECVQQQTLQDSMRTVISSNDSSNVDSAQHRL